ncbi:MAG: Fe-S cluster assembly protein SufD [Rhodospirillales bacterium]|nr:MAG: Fe-S cluster assembly protein SufD [Rhodospirillales bacterium]
MTTEAGAALPSWVQRYQAVGDALPGADRPWLNARRAEALAAFAASGLPTRRQEAWKYTDLKALASVPFAPAIERATVPAIDRVPTLLTDDEPLARLVFVDGHLRPEWSATAGLPEGVVLADLVTALARHEPLVEHWLGERDGIAGRSMVALNAALMDGGYVIWVPRGTIVDAPIEITLLSGAARGAHTTPLVHHPRILVVIEDGAEATLVEHWAACSDATYFNNVVADVQVGAGARLRHYRIQEESVEAYHVTTLRADLGRDARYEAFSFSTGARLSRLDAEISLTGTGASLGFGGAFLMRGRQHCDTTSVIDHRVPHTACREVFKGTLDGQARGVFQGRIVVHPGADKTDGQQSCRTLLLSDGAEIDAKPELEIYADDVKCSHGATAGQLDANALFFLRSRGLDETTARRLLIEAFLSDALDEISLPALRGRLTERIEGWMREPREDRE